MVSKQVKMNAKTTIVNFVFIFFLFTRLEIVVKRTTGFHKCWMDNNEQTFFKKHSLVEEELLFFITLFQLRKR